ncbi:efflux RND transporter periplasmic adaptor subunit [candidate division KSB3 bacterium]|uniref:Efflux RND transporter periplasmic adaptor subunit n=1 Tax=candidate division KSB3 bacterium TaxID=2044937 RepID=A0A9D5JVE5_9BACT|nr:efflux RND transporter periplasmic adaptor subunit [candidate division KSB3 bacterium]MBD3324992.1 efflux RND transporter periplasmic adaptor subunit [candidate division KSB3 bacterium]
MMKKVLGISILIALAGLLGWQIYQKVSQSAPATSGGWGGRGGGRPAVAVEIGEVQQRTIQDIGQFTGSLSPKSQFIVTPKISGRLKQLFVDVGDPVERNQLIAVIDDEGYLQEVEKAQAELEVAKANLEESRSALAIAKRDFERAQNLQQNDILSQSGLDSAEAKYNAAVANYRVSQALVKNRESGLHAAQLHLSYTEIRASWETGDQPRVVGQRFVDEGSILKANDPIVSILDLNAITCVINVIERDYFKVRQDQPATIETDAFPGQTFQGRVARIAPLLNESSRQAEIEIEIPNSDGLLKPGMFVRVQIEFANIEDTTVVPVAALVKRNDQQGVYRADLENMTAQFVPVQVGVLTTQFAQILDPPLSGSVVTLGQYLLEDGATIVLPGQQEQTPSQERPQRQEP